MVRAITKRRPTLSFWCVTKILLGTHPVVGLVPPNGTGTNPVAASRMAVFEWDHSHQTFPARPAGLARGAGHGGRNPARIRRRAGVPRAGRPRHQYSISRYCVCEHG